MEVAVLIVVVLVCLFVLSFFSDTAGDVLDIGCSVIGCLILAGMLLAVLAVVAALKGL